MSVDNEDKSSLNATSNNGWGGARPGAGRKPKALRYAVLTDQIEERISLALPRIIDAMVERAEKGDNTAAKYLCDRIMGMPAKLKAAPANDPELPYNEHNLEETLKKQGYKTDIQVDIDKVKGEILQDKPVDIKAANDYYCIRRLNDIENANLNYDTYRRNRILSHCSETMACEENIDNPNKFFHYSKFPGIGNTPAPPNL